MTQAADVFISYSREDKDRVLDLVAKLRTAGVSVWIDQSGIDGAALWGEAIVHALESAKVLLLMVTESAGRSHNVAKEVMLTSERKGHILPVLLEQITIPPSLRYPLAGIQSLFRRVIEIKPGFYSAYLDLAQACQGLGRTEESEAARRQVMELLPNYLLQNPDDSRARMVYALALANSGRKDEAANEGAKALELSPDDPVMLYNGACLYSQLGEVARAIAALKQAVTAGYWNFGWMQHDPDLNPLRGEPEFVELMQGR